MPPPDVYDQEIAYWPWGRVIAAAVDWVVGHARRNAFVVDYMCGTGNLLSQVVDRRPDILAVGCDTSESYVDYARRRNPRVTFVQADALSYAPSGKPDVLICTAGLHHLTRENQSLFLEKIAGELPVGGFFLLGEEVIGDYSNEIERRLAVGNLFSAIIEDLSTSDAPPSVVAAAAEMFVNDWCERGEFKTSFSELTKMIGRHFEVVNSNHIWPGSAFPFGDHFLVCLKHMGHDRKRGEKVL